MSAFDPLSSENKIPYLLQKKRTWFIFGSFFVLTLPLVLIWSIYGPFHPVTLTAIALHSCIFEMTHFSVTWSIYLRSDNLKYFLSTNRNRIIYFLLPLLALFFYLIASWLSPLRAWSAIATYAFVAVRFLDFFHVGRQSFGVLQMFKRDISQDLPAVVRKFENALFVGLAIFQTKRAMIAPSPSPDFFDLTMKIVLGPLVLILALLYIRSYRASRNKGTVLLAAGYLALQSGAAALAVYEIAFYTFALAIHNVEYHILITPRIFKTPLKAEGSVDQILGFFRRNPYLFYGGLLMFSVLLFAMTQTEVVSALFTSKANSPLVLTNLFNGIFLAHYTVEAFIWKRSSPHWKAEMSGLYD